MTSRFSEPWELETLGHPLLLWVRVGGRDVELRLNKQSHVPKATEPGLEFWMSVLDQDSVGHDTVTLESCVYPSG